MKRKKIALWSDDEMIARSGSGTGTFKSCKPSMTFYPTATVPNSDKLAGCIIICPGGGYQFKTMDYEGEDIALMLNDNGLNAFLLDYRVTPDYYPAPLNDALRAIEIARDLADELHYSTDKVGILGFSAGGHLAASAATMWNSPKSRPDAVVLCYPVISMTKIGHVGSRSNLLGNKTDSSVVSDMSCENRVDRQTPPAFIWHTSDDEAVSVENSLVFASALSAKNIPFEMHIYPHGKHGLGLAKSDTLVSGWARLCIDWLKRIEF